MFGPAQCKMALQYLTVDIAKLRQWLFCFCLLFFRSSFLLTDVVVGAALRFLLIELAVVTNEEVTLFLDSNK